MSRQVRKVEQVSDKVSVWLCEYAGGRHLQIRQFFGVFEGEELKDGVTGSDYRVDSYTMQRARGFARRLVGTST
jgi:hypothetical protein